MNRANEKIVEESVAHLLSRAENSRGLQIGDLLARVGLALEKYLFKVNENVGHAEIKEFIGGIRADDLCLIVTISDQAGFSEPGWDTPSGKIGGGDADGPQFVPDGPGAGKTRVSGPKDSRGMPLVVGANVRHPQFGLGRIVGITSGQDARAQIEFRQAGRKTLVLQYARLERVD